MSESSEAPSHARPLAVPTLQEKVRSLRLSEAESAPRSGSGVWILAVPVLLLAASTAYFAFETFRLKAEQVVVKPSDSDASSSTGSSTASTAVPASTTNANTPAAPPPGTVVLESKGYIIPAHQILVTPKVSGMVLRLNIEEGKRVKQGDVLAELETTDYKADFDRVTAMLEVARNKLKELKNGFLPEEIQQAKSELDEMTVQREQLREAYQRAVQLREKRSMSPDEFEKVQSAYRAMENRVIKLRNAHELMVKGPRIERIKLAEAEVQQAEADLVKAKWRLDNCNILSPISGTILTKKAEEGNVVNPIAFSGSQAVCEMADLSDLEVDLSIQERDISKVFQKQRCVVRAEAYPERVYDGVVSRLMPIADRAKGAVPVRVKLKVPANEEGVYLKPEMGAVVTFYSMDPTAEKKSASEPSATDRSPKVEAAKESATIPTGKRPT